MTTGFTEEWLTAYEARQGRRASGKPSRAQRAVSRKRSKYGNRKTEVDGIIFDSAKEANRWQELKLLEKAGEISNLDRQVKFSLDVNGEHICNYFADHTYDEKGEVVVEDVKSTATKKTKDYAIKKKLMWAIYRIRIREY